jgi:folate-dependent phosphoribosylglycinamide formyltransferase PurN
MYTVNLISGGGSTNLAVLEAQKPGGKLHGLVKTEAIICNNSKAAGIQRAIDVGFPKENIHLVSRAKGSLGEQILEVLYDYKPNYFHQLGWMPHTPSMVIDLFRGLNQHLGPGGEFMYGERRIFTHMLFCRMIGERRPIPIFCQYVDPAYDQGKVVYARFEDFAFTESVSAIAKRLLPIEHEVQIEALFRLATGIVQCFPVPRVYETPKEKRLMDAARLEAEGFYKSMEIKGIEAEVFLPTETRIGPIR